MTYLFVLEVRPMQEGQIYLSLPLHCTLARFTASQPAQEVLAKTWPIFAKTPPVIMRIGKVSRFGSSKRPRRLEVNLIDKTPELNSLQIQLYETLNALGVEYSNASYVGEGYKPHVSRRGGDGLDAGMEYVCEAVYFIEVRRSSHASSQKFIYARLPLSG